MILLLIATILGLRLLTLDQIYEKQKDMFIMNSKSILKIQKVDTLNITNFYVVLHSRKIFFYTKGSYYGFIYDNDNIKLKLSPVSMGKVQYFSQDVGPTDIEEKVPTRSIKVLKWDDLIKKRNGEAKDDPTGIDSDSIKNDAIGDNMSKGKGLVEKEHVDRLSLRHRMPMPSTSPGSVRKLEDSKTYEDAGYSIALASKGVSKNYRRTDDEECDVLKPSCHKPKDLLHYKSEMKIEAKPLKRPEIAGKSMDEIESDSDVLDSKTLDIKVNTLDRSKQTFVLKNDKNLCVTYFERSFILAECRKSKRQIFKFVEIEEVMNRISPKKRPAEDDTIEGEREGSSTEEKEEFPGLIKRDNGRTGRKERKYPSKPEEDREESIEYVEKIEQMFPKSQEETSQKDINYLHNPQSQMRINMESQCRSLLNRSLGRLEGLPEECKRLLGVPTNPAIAGAAQPRNGISEFSMVKTSYVPAKKRTQSDVQKEKTPIYEFNRKNNILARLEKALRT